jgi:hypothetical protein
MASQFAVLVFDKVLPARYETADEAVEAVQETLRLPPNLDWKVIEIIDARDLIPENECPHYWPQNRRPCIYCAKPYPMGSITGVDNHERVSPPVAAGVICTCPADFCPAHGRLDKTEMKHGRRVRG